jgi:hypothetical protein
LKLRGLKFNGNTTKRCSEPSNSDIVKDRDLIPSKTSCVKKITLDVAMQLPEHASMRAVYIELTKKKIYGTTLADFFQQHVKPFIFFSLKYNFTVLFYFFKVVFLGLAVG